MSLDESKPIIVPSKIWANNTVSIIQLERPSKEPWNDAKLRILKKKYKIMPLNI